MTGGLTVQGDGGGGAEGGRELSKCQHLNSVLCLSDHTVYEVAGCRGVVDGDGLSLAGFRGGGSVEEEVALGTSWGIPGHLDTATPTLASLETSGRAGGNYMRWGKGYSLTNHRGLGTEIIVGAASLIMSITQSMKC